MPLLVIIKKKRNEIGAKKEKGKLTVVAIVHASKDDNPDHGSNDDTGAEHVFTSNFCADKNLCKDKVVDESDTAEWSNPLKGQSLFHMSI